MNRWKSFSVAVIVLAALTMLYFVSVVHRGFSAKDQPSAAETLLARGARDLGIPSAARNEKVPLSATPSVLDEARKNFTAHCAGCHGKDGDGRSGIGPNLYPRAPDLRRPETQKLSDGELHYIIQNGVRLTGMPALGNPHASQDHTSAWQLVLYIRSIAASTPKESAKKNDNANSAHYVGSAACQKCHAEIYGRWKKLPWPTSCATHGNIRTRSFLI